MRYFLLCFSLLFTANALANKTNNNDAYLQHPFYIGALGGYGDTDWQRLISEDDLTAEATPISATGNGAVYGGLIGYQPFKNFAFELQYLHFPDADLEFAPGNAMGLMNTTSKTQYFAAIAKVLIPLGETWCVFGDIGAAYVTRSDDIADLSNTRPTFGFGGEYMFSQHWFSTLSFEYTPGTGEAIVDASAYYIPYLYSIQYSLGYRF